MVQTLKPKFRDCFLDLVPALMSKKPEETLKKSKDLKISSILVEIISHIISKNNNVDDYTQPGGILQILYGVLCNPTDNKMTESITMCLQAIANHPLFSIEEHLWNTGVLGLFLKFVFQTYSIRYQVMIISFFILNPNDEIVEYGNQLLNAYLPLDFHDAKSREESKESAIISPKKGTDRNSGYINLHGLEFDEKSSSKMKKAKDVIEEELTRLDKEYTESLRVIWDSRNTERIKDLIMSTKFEKALEDHSILKNIPTESFKNPLLEGELLCNDVILRIYNSKSPKILKTDNKLFLKNLFSLLRKKYNKSVRLSYIIENDGMPENRPLPRESQKVVDGGYISYD